MFGEVDGVLGAALGLCEVFDGVRQCREVKQMSHINKFQSVAAGINNAHRACVGAVAIVLRRGICKIELLGSCLVTSDERGCLSVAIILLGAASVPINIFVIFEHAEVESKTRKNRQLFALIFDVFGHNNAAVGIHPVIGGEPCARIGKVIHRHHPYRRALCC